ncbi:AfsR/SARP family transcriptional regulator [Phytohabitans rumicis]|nr:BTAD domain-containing putative transcriptional regulator [Phytohabitans rumicis]
MERTLVALLLNAGHAVTIEHLVDAVWPNPPATARHQIQDLVSRLRQILLDEGACASLISTQRAGYLLQADYDSIDAHTFDRLVASARQDAATRPDTAAAGLRQALSLWRGEPLAGIRGRRAEAAARAMQDRRLAVLQECLTLEMSLGRQYDAAAELYTLVARHPLRESLVAMLMQSLTATGRRGDALEAFRDLRKRLADELGVEPGPDIERLHHETLRYEAPLPLTSPMSLPLDTSGFTGRHVQLARLDALLDMTEPGATVPTILVLSGTAGVGKTTLAVHWARRVRGRFPDGQVYLNLRGFDPVGPPTEPAEALPVLLQMLRVPAAQIPATLQDQVDLYRGILAGRRLLIVLDNVRDPDQVRPLLPGEPGCTVVIASRNQLTSLVAIEGANPLPLDLLSTDEARELLIRRLGAARVAAEPDAVEDIIDRCARLPLALAIVAARAASHPGFALAALTSEPHSPGADLDAFDGGDHATQVRTVFSWSYQTLTPGAARLFRLLGLHPGPDIAPPAAASLAGTPPEQVRPLVAELARAHLVTEHIPGRFTFHDLLRLYAAELAHLHDGDTERRTATHRLLDHYLHTAHAAHHLMRPHREPVPVSPPQPGVIAESLANHGQALAWFTAEHAVLVAAIAHAGKVGFEAHTWQLALTLDEFFYRQGHWRAWVTTHRHALDAARRQAERSGQAHIHRSLANAHARLGQYHDAHIHFDQALDLFTELHDHTSQAHTLLGIAWLHARQHRRRQALDHARQALDLYRATGNQTGQANALNSVGWYHAQLGDHHQTLIHCEHALTLLQNCGDHLVEEAGTWDSLGYAHHHLGNYERAITCGQHAVDLYRKIGDRYNEADALTHLGDTHHATGNHHTAQTIWHQALTILTELQHPDAHQLHTKLDRTD